MQLRFWGVRGSVPWSTADTIRVGCNTPCLELTDPKSRARLLLDAGCGIVGAGRVIHKGDIPILLTHFHWDHLQGLPFFEPFYRPSCATTIWTPALAGYEQRWITTLFQLPFVSVPYDRLPAPPIVRTVTSGGIAIGPFEVQTLCLTHPGSAFAYRIAVNGSDVVYATDHEHGNQEVDARLVEFSRGATVAVFDAHFTPEELTEHRGWGHSSWLEAAHDAAAGRVERLFLFHHKPGRSDRELAEIEICAQRVFKETRVAAEGETFDV